MATKSWIQMSAVSHGANADAFSSEAMGNITVSVHGASQHPVLLWAAPVFREFIPCPKNTELRTGTAAGFQ